MPTRALLLILSLALLTAPAARAEDPERAALEQSLKAQALLLRGFPGDAEVHYTEQAGHLALAGKPRFFTCGALMVESVKVHRSHGAIDEILLKGMRGTVLAGEAPGQFRYSAAGTKISVDIALSGADPGLPARLLAELSYPDLPAMVAALPPRLQSAFHVADGTAGSTGMLAGQWLNLDGQWTQIAATGKHGSDLKPPVVTESPEPEFTREARRQKNFSGKVLIGLALDASGSIAEIWLLRPLGFGLDEKALAAVAGYKFKPALYEGRPVGMQLNVEVNFQLFDSAL